jgi:hypothetical protein
MNNKPNPPEISPGRGDNSEREAKDKAPLRESEMKSLGGFDINGDYEFKKF